MGIPVEASPVLLDIKEVEAKLETSRSVLIGGAHILKALQTMPKRNFTQEDRVAFAVDDIIQHAKRDIFEVGVDSAQGLGIRTTDSAPRFNAMNRAQLERYLDIGYSDELKQYLGNEVQGKFLLHGFQRAEWLGYGKELGRDWYLTFGWAETYYIPVKGLRDVKLRVITNDI